MQQEGGCVDSGQWEQKGDGSAKLVIQDEKRETE